MKRGADPERILLGTGLTVDLLTDRSTVVTLGQELKIAEQLQATLGDLTGVGLEAGRRMTVGDVGIWAFAIMSSATIGEAIRIVLRFNQLAPAFVMAELGDATDMLVVTLHDDHLPVDVREVLAQLDLAAIARMDAAVGIDIEDVVLVTRFTGHIADELARMYRPATLLQGSARHQLRIPRNVAERRG